MSEDSDMGKAGPTPGETRLPVEYPVSAVKSFDTVTFDPTSEHYRTQFDPHVDTPSLAVVAAVAAITGTAVADLSPLNTVIDTEALNALLTPRRDDDAASARVAFAIDDHDVTISQQGNLSIRPVPKEN